MAFLSLWLAGAAALAQEGPQEVAEPEWRLVDSLAVSVERLSVGRDGSLYLADRSGRLLKCDFSGQVAETFQQDDGRAPDLLACWQTVRAFLFFADGPSCLWLGRRLTPGRDGEGTALQPLPPCLLACPSADGTLWLWQGRDLARYSPRLDRFVSRNALGGSGLPSLRPLFMREYDHRLYVALEGGEVAAFDAFGALAARFDVPELGWFGFREGSLYFAQGDRLRFLPLYEGEPHEERLPRPGRYAALSEGRLALVGEGFVRFYSRAK